ncbi:28S ribosomal protein S14, mitochondrial [Amphibalanus amphitrite]|uniref:28S ribosomal protein S14, mitochondrial n=1 Tax=Amphibalanus amphitrite TaxID=1232801 RepID=A0A6A4VIB5_AMPAM|nr:28S ribosomal protein S14, mitochondrial [Amphibalanus amphitrite]
MSYSLGLQTLLVALLACHTVHTYPTECSFPEHWRGTWFQSNVHQEIRISDKEVSSKGNCTLASQQKYVVHNAVGRCYKCVIFYEKHVNVIQYKESFCNPDSKPPDLDFLCGHVNGDIQLYSMFRVNYRPIACPLRGPFSFSYSRGHMLQEECHQPNSRLGEVGLLSAAAPHTTQVRTKYGDWRTIKDQAKRHCVRDFGIQRVRLNAIRKNRILPAELRAAPAAELTGAVVAGRQLRRLAARPAGAHSRNVERTGRRA